VNVAPSAPASATNSVSLLGGGDVNAANNTANDLTTIVPGPDLTITKTHAALFTQGQTAVPALNYTLTVSNNGASPTAGTVTLIDSVPPGLIPVSAGGTGWTCTTSLQSVTCTRNDALAAAASYPPVILTVDVESDAPASVTNTATISGGGDVDTSNNTANDFTQIDRGQDLTVSKSHSGTFTQGQTGTYTITVTNGGSASTIGTHTLIDAVPAGLLPTSATGTGWTCTVSGQTVNCTRDDPLAGGSSYDPVTVIVDVADNAPASVTNRALIAGGGDVFSLNNVAEDTTVVVPGPDPTITKTHPSGFGPGQTGVMFIVTVINQGNSQTQGRVDVVDDLPSGMTARSASAPGWSCEVSDQVVACSRTDALAPAASYPPIMLTVDVAPELPPASSLINTARVSGGGDIESGNNTAEDAALLSLYTQHFAEGSTGFFQEHLGILNASATSPANLSIRLFPEVGVPVDLQFSLDPLGRRTVDINAALPGTSAGVSAMVTSDQPIAATRQMTWGDPVYGSTLESGTPGTSQQWYFSEGATNIFSVFFLIENPGDTTANVTLTHLLEGGAAPIAHSLDVPPLARRTVLVDDLPGLSSAHFATIVTSDQPIVAERAMYLNTTTRMWEGGTAGSGTPALSTSWWFAEGSTGFFHPYLLLGNPALSEATVTVQYHAPAGTITRSYNVPPQARRTVDVKLEVPELGSAAFAMSLTSTLPIVAERAMWWGPFPWSEGSAGIGTTVTGSVWAIGEAAQDGPAKEATFVLVANASATAGQVGVTLLYDDGTSEQREYTLPGGARLTVDVGTDFAQAGGKRFSALIESLTAGVPISVEYARYQSPTSLGDGGDVATATRIR
jgi:uncharacterized repeat protein (TIGR01451 family)